MKKIAVCLLSGLLILTLNSEGFGENIKIGTVINYTVATDITTFINGCEIPSMNIQGRTAIVAEDLRNC
jgi:hypothetical protein